MKRICVDNYEEFVLDYLEGNLSDELCEEMKQFLLQHPEIEAELDGVEEATLIPDDCFFNNKEALKLTPIISFSNITEDNYEDVFISYYEGLLSDVDESNLNHFLDLNPTLKQEFKDYGLTYLKPQTIPYRNKESLKRKSILLGQFFYYSASGIAAGLLVLLAFNFMIRNNQSIKEDLPNLSALNPIIPELKSNELAHVPLKEKPSIKLPVQKKKNTEKQF